LEPVALADGAGGALIISVAIANQNGDRFCLAFMIMEAEGQGPGPFEGVAIGTAVFVGCLAGIVDAVGCGDDYFASIAIDRQAGPEPKATVFADDEFQAAEDTATKTITI
jgi:hypothetical protein